MAEQKYIRQWGDRRDGRWVKDVPGLQTIMGHILPNRTDCEVFMKDSFDMINEIMEDGDVVLLSPASASWDQYKECEVRGDEFCDLVNNLK